MYITSEADGHEPLRQSYELTRLREQIAKLEKQLREAQQQGFDVDDEDVSQETRRASVSTAKFDMNRQRRFKSTNRIDNLYFGTPGYANLSHEVSRLFVYQSVVLTSPKFANMQLGLESLTHTVPKGRDIYARQDTIYPFHILDNHSSVRSLVKLPMLNNRDYLSSCLDHFQRRAHACSFPQTSSDLPLPKRDIDRFLEDPEHNATGSPDMLALLFAMIATGLQVGQYDRSGGEWVAGDVEASLLESDVYSKLPSTHRVYCLSNSIASWRKHASSSSCVIHESTNSSSHPESRVDGPISYE